MPEVAVNDVRAFLEKKQKTRDQRRAGLLDTAQKDAESIIEMLVRKYDPLRIYQWGSLVYTENFSECSDIDIALEGLSDPLDGLRALDDASLMTDLPVDLVELERIHPAHAESIRLEGKLVYERE